MPWFRLYHEARSDAKLRLLPDDEHRVWFDLLCFSSEQETRGSIEAGDDRFPLAIEVARGDMELLTRTLDRLVKMRIIADGGDRLTFLHFKDRNYDKPSDQPERVAERVTRHRESVSNRQVVSETPVKRGETPIARDLIKTELERELEGELNARGADAPVAASAAPQEQPPVPVSVVEAKAATRPAPKPNRYGQVLDALKEHGIDYPGGRRDASEVAKCSASPAVIAEAYATFEEWCGDYGMSNKSLWYVCQRIAAYQAWRDGKKARASPNGRASGGQMSASGQQAVLDKLLEDIEHGHSGDDKGAEGAHGLWPEQRAEDQRGTQGGSGRILNAGNGLPVRLVGPTGQSH
jgi:hypothetical protein